jgi:hypothetical protein
MTDTLDKQCAAVRIRFDPYCHRGVQDLLQAVVKEFGKNKERYYWEWLCATRAQSGLSLSDEWTIIFHFKDPHDAIIFGLKYSR